MVVGLLAFRLFAIPARGMGHGDASFGPFRDVFA